MKNPLIDSVFLFISLLFMADCTGSIRLKPDPPAGPVYLQRGSEHILLKDPYQNLDRGVKKHFERIHASLSGLNWPMLSGTNFHLMVVVYSSLT